MRSSITGVGAPNSQAGTREMGMPDSMTEAYDSISHEEDDCIAHEHYETISHPQI